MLIGATMNETDLPSFKAMLAGNSIMRIFPVRAQGSLAGSPVKVLPPWTDSRFAYCREVGAIPFVSTKVDGSPAGLAHVRTQLLAMPEWVTQLYITDRHEPEGDVTPEQFRANFLAFLDMVDGLPATLRARIRCGPVLTRTWTERPAGGLKPGRSYRLHDPGVGDFFGVDMYVQTGTATSVVSPDTLPTAQEFTAELKAYRYSPTDRRDRIIPELGVIGMPSDVDGAARAAWIRAVHAELASWDRAETGWVMLGWIWWNSLGKATGEVAQVGQRRDFPLHLRTAPRGSGRGAGGAAEAVELPGNPPAPVAAYNEIWAAEQTVTPVDDPAPDAPPPAGSYDDGYTAGWAAGRQQLLADIAALAVAPAP
jgi:hypothetical protein